MLIELNGMSFLLNISAGAEGQLQAAVIDEAFAFEQSRQAVTTAHCVHELVQSYSGIALTDGARSDISQHFAESAQRLH